MKASLFAGICGVSLLPTIASAAVLFDNFNDGNDSGVPSWTRVNTVGLGSYAFPSGGYQITAAASPAIGTTGPTRAGSVMNGSTETDFVLSVDIVDWSAAPTTIAGLLGRISDIGPAATDGYALALVPASGNLSIQRLNNEAPTALGSATGAALNPANDYRIVFTGIGSNFTGQLFDLANLAVPLVTVAGSDIQFTSGLGGLLTFDGNTPPATTTVSVTFDNFSSIPEPSAALLALGVLGVGSLRRRR